jgi:hypothetical protein
MMRFGRNALRLANVAVLLLLVCVLFESGSPPEATLKTRLDQVTARKAFDFVTWEFQALTGKMRYGVLSPHRWMEDEAQSRFVLDYLEDIRVSDRLMGEIDRIYTDPEIEEPDQVSAVQQSELAALRRKMALHAPIAEAILEDQVSEVLAAGGVGPLSWVLPPVKGTFTPLPHVLIVSPRERIETVYQQQLVAGLTAAEQAEIEERVRGADETVAAYVTNIGGLAAYPAMLLERGSIDWVADVMAHEWVHHYLMFYPLGWDYMKSGEARTINETTASIVGEWAGQEIVLRFYIPLMASGKRLPSPLKPEHTDEAAPLEVRFDFRAEMHRTRVNVDRLLAEGKIKEAEWYMEAQRRYFVAQGYRIRKLNQAYFAFHGAYAGAPGGAAGEDPIGPLVRRAWALSSSPVDFLRTLSGMTTLEQLRAQFSF